MDAHALAAELCALAERVERLPAYSHRNPHAFHEAKSILAIDLVALAEVITARCDPPPEPLPILTLRPRRGPFVMSFRKVPA